MHFNFTLKDLEDIGDEVQLCSMSEFTLTALTNKLEGEINGFIKIVLNQDNADHSVCLFSIRSGEQISLCDLNYEEQLIIPDVALRSIEKSLSLSVEVFGKSFTTWSNMIKKINELHANDKNNNFEKLPDDLPVPEFKYYVAPIKETSKKENFFKRLLNRIQNKLRKGNNK